MWPFRFKGMIYPKLALGYEDSRDVMERKSVCMVHYLRSRRAISDYGLPAYRRRQGMTAKVAWRKKHFSMLKPDK